MGAPGFDDAPEVKLNRGNSKAITFVYPYYENPSFFTRQMETWLDYPVQVKRNLRAIIVDDGSPNTSAESVLKQFTWLPFSIRCFRIGVDVRWNWLAARNIGMHHAEDGWCLMTDMDHVVTSQVAQALTEENHDERVIYRFKRMEHTGEAIHPHPNSMLLTRAMFWRAGGYDEALSGYYGTDGEWRRRCAATAKVRTSEHALVRYEYVSDSSTTAYKRKQPEDAAKKRIIASRAKNWKPKVLSFPYQEVSV